MAENYFSNGRLKTIGTVLVIIASLAVNWGITINQLAASIKAIDENKQLSLAIQRELLDHEKLPWHYGYAIQLPINNAKIDDLEARVRTMEKSK